MHAPAQIQGNGLWVAVELASFSSDLLVDLHSEIIRISYIPFESVIRASIHLLAESCPIQAATFARNGAFLLVMGESARHHLGRVCKS
jgi:hypothetical protein